MKQNNNIPQGYKEKEWEKKINAPLFRGAYAKGCYPMGCFCAAKIEQKNYINKFL